jgi:hypothetical protein
METSNYETKNMQSCKIKREDETKSPYISRNHMFVATRRTPHDLK